MTRLHMQSSHYKQSLHDRGVCVIIPTYNNAGTIADVVKRTLLHCDDVIVVNDGATDSTKEILTGISGITLINSPKNEGKGAALRRGFRKALEQGFTYAITLDADGQHYPEDLPLFLEANIEHPGCLIVGERNLEGVERSKGSSFANAFSNFWFCVQTFHRLPHDHRYISNYSYCLLLHICREFHYWKSDNLRHSFLIDLQNRSLRTAPAHLFLYELKKMSQF